MGWYCILDRLLFLPFTPIKLAAFERRFNELASALINYGVSFDSDGITFGLKNAYSLRTGIF